MNTKYCPQSYQELEEALKNRTVVTGTVKTIKGYGVDIEFAPDVTALLHIVDISWRRVRHPSYVYSIGDTVSVRVLQCDSSRNRFIVGAKQLTQDPWENPKLKSLVGSKVVGKVTAIVDYGFFVELADLSVEGLVHVSEISWTDKNVKPQDVVQLGQSIEVIVIDNDLERRRIELSLKLCLPNPWQEFADCHQVGDIVTGKMISITDFGVFVKVGDIDALIKVTDNTQYILLQRGNNITVKISSIDVERERVYLELIAPSGEKE